MPYRCFEPCAHVELRCTYHSSSHHYVSRPIKMPGYCTYRYAFISAKTQSPDSHHKLKALCMRDNLRARGGACVRADFICATPHVSVCVRALRRFNTGFHLRRCFLCAWEARLCDHGCYIHKDKEIIVTLIQADFGASSIMLQRAFC